VSNPSSVKGTVLTMSLSVLQLCNFVMPLPCDCVVFWGSFYVVVYFCYGCLFALLCLSSF